LEGLEFVFLPPFLLKSRGGGCLLCPNLLSLDNAIELSKEADQVGDIEGACARRSLLRFVRAGIDPVKV